MPKKKSSHGDLLLVQFLCCSIYLFYLLDMYIGTDDVCHNAHGIVVYDTSRNNSSQIYAEQIMR